MIARELRSILDDLHDAEHGAVPKPLVRERLERLAEHVERLGAEPPAEHVLEAIHAGLDPEQTIRGYAIEHVIHRHQVNDSHLLLSQLWPEADRIAAYIRGGRHPAPATVCTCRQAAPPVLELDGDCPDHGTRLEAS